MPPDGLENKFRILSLLPFDRRIGRKHTAVLAFILDWHHRKYGDALASVRHIVAELKSRDPFGKGFYTGDVHAALTDLVTWGYLTQQKGSGRRASRYVPNWEIFASVRQSPNTTAGEISVLESPNASVRAAPNTTSHSVRESPNKDPLTETRLQDGATKEEGAALPAPCADALGGAASGAGFEELWRAYGYRKDKVKAREQFEKVNVQNLAHYIAAASAWREAWAAQGKGNAPRKSLHVWLQEERFDEDPPTAYAAKERRPRRINRENARPPVSEPANDNVAFHCAPARIAPGRYEAAIVDSQVERDLSSTTAALVVDLGHDAFTIHVAIDSAQPTEQEAGQLMLSNIVGALGLNGVEESRALHNIPFQLEVTSDHTVRFHKLAAAQSA